MRLITAHRILIAAGIAFFLFYALVQTRMFFSTGGVVALLQAVVSVLIAIGFVLYYRTLARWDRR